MCYLKWIQRILRYIPNANMKYYKKGEESLQIHPLHLRIGHPTQGMLHFCCFSPTSCKSCSHRAASHLQNSSSKLQKLHAINNIRNSTEIVAKAFSKKEGERECSLETLRITSIYSQQNLTALQTAEKNSYKKFRRFSQTFKKTRFPP